MKWTALPPREEIPIEKRRVLSKTRKLALLIKHPRCYLCGEKLGDLSGVDFDHLTPLAIGGEQGEDDILPAHRECHRAKTRSRDVPMIAKVNRLRKREAGLRRKRKPIPSRPFPKRQKNVPSHSDRD